MPVTGLFFLPSQGTEVNPTQEIFNRLAVHYNPVPLQPWTLSHRLFRETTSNPPFPNPSFNSLDKSKNRAIRYLQFLTLSHHSPQTYIAITATSGDSQTRAGTPASSSIGAEAASGEPVTIISIPSPSSDEFIQLMVSKFGPLWQQRQILNVFNGQTFQVGELRVRVGEVRLGTGGASHMGRGAVCEVEWISGEEEEDWESAEAVIRAFWEGLGIRGARQVFTVPGLAEGEGSVRQWCEMLRVRA